MSTASGTDYESSNEPFALVSSIKGLCVLLPSNEVLAIVRESMLSPSIDLEPSKEDSSEFAFFSASLLFPRVSAFSLSEWVMFP